MVITIYIYVFLINWFYRLILELYPTSVGYGCTRKVEKNCGMCTTFHWFKASCSLWSGHNCRTDPNDSTEFEEPGWSCNLLLVCLNIIFFGNLILTCTHNQLQEKCLISTGKWLCLSMRYDIPASNRFEHHRFSLTKNYSGVYTRFGQTQLSEVHL
jgi:hypothetical protein